MTDKELRDAAVVELKKTTQGYLKSNGQPRSIVGEQWTKGLDLLAQIGMAPPPPPPPPGNVIYKVDYNTGNFSQWESGAIIEGPATGTIVANPSGSGQVAKFQVSNPSGNGRIEYQQTDPAKTGAGWGATSTYDVRLYVPASTVWMPHPSQNNLIQYKINSPDCVGNGLVVDAQSFSEPHFLFRVRGGQVTSSGGGCGMTTDIRLDLGKVDRDRWISFRWTIKWHHDPAQGFVEISRDGVVVVAKRFCATTLDHVQHKLRQGLYQGAHSGTTIVYADGLTVSQ